ncbi:MAG: creatininase family protein [bacterium]|jgi:creatinine amidohydrolase|nr:creatininase family protein [candidate division KSB1 bacterium]MDH7559442.1 creatininase family protein [bacterium]
MRNDAQRVGRTPRKAPENNSAASCPPVCLEELSAADFGTALKLSARTCVVACGVLEKHGLHLPLGTDVLNAREIALRAAAEEYVVVFPPFYFGQIFEAKHQPGTIAYSERLIWAVLQETCDELARNGFLKIVLLNGHGGNNAFLKFFCQAQLTRERDYAVYLFLPAGPPERQESVSEKRRTEFDFHAGEVETSMLMAHRPELVHLQQASASQGKDLQRLKTLLDTFTGIWWYARFPDHYAGDARPACAELGELVLAEYVRQFVGMLRAVKADRLTLKLQKEFFAKARRPEAGK